MSLQHERELAIGDIFRQSLLRIAPSAGIEMVRQSPRMKDGNVLLSFVGKFNGGVAIGAVEGAGAGRF